MYLDKKDVSGSICMWVESHLIDDSFKSGHDIDSSLTVFINK